MRSLPSIQIVEQTFSLQEMVMEALQYFPIGTHDLLGQEFAEELTNYGHIYMYRFRPTLKMRWFFV